MFKSTIRNAWRGLLFGENKFRQASARAVDSKADLRWGPDGKGWRRIIAPNGICVLGTWEITADNPYTGYFRKGSKGLTIGRFSSDGNETKRGQRRSISLGMKIYPTTDPEHATPLIPASVIVQEDLGGMRTDYMNDAELVNAPSVHAYRRGIYFLIMLRAGPIFQNLDKVGDSRQNYEVAELGKAPNEPTNAPDHMLFKMTPGQRQDRRPAPRFPGRDLRPHVQAGRLGADRRHGVRHLGVEQRPQDRRPGVVDRDGVGLEADRQVAIHRGDLPRTTATTSSSSTTPAGATTATIRPRTFASTKCACVADEDDRSSRRHAHTLRRHRDRQRLWRRDHGAPARREGHARARARAGPPVGSRSVPRRPGDAWIFNHDRPARQNGWMDMRFFRRMAVAQAAGVGGGSLTYSSVAVEASPEVFTQGWPQEITYAELKPHYDTVAREMDLQVIPDGQLTQRFVLAREAARNLGYKRSFLEGPAGRQLLRGLELSARGPVQSEALASVHERARPAPGHVHPPGELRHRLRRAGEEQPGRQLHSESRAARRRGASAASRPLHRAPGRQATASSSIGSREGGRFVARRRPSAWSWPPGAWARRSSCCAAAISTGRFRSLSPMLGKGWSANANFISMATYSEKDRRQAIDRADHRQHAGFHGRQLQRPALRRRGRRVSEPAAQRPSRLTSTAARGRGSAGICSRSSRSTCVTTRRSAI